MRGAGAVEVDHSPSSVRARLLEDRMRVHGRRRPARLYPSCGCRLARHSPERCTGALLRAHSSLRPPTLAQHASMGSLCRAVVAMTFCKTFFFPTCAQVQCYNVRARGAGRLLYADIPTGGRAHTVITARPRHGLRGSLLAPPHRLSAGRRRRCCCRRCHCSLS